MTNPTPRSAAPSDIQRLEAVSQVAADIDELVELPTDQALARLEAAQQVLAEALRT